jgi:hypothetical protein
MKTFGSSNKKVEKRAKALAGSADEGSARGEKSLAASEAGAVGKKSLDAGKHLRVSKCA